MVEAFSSWTIASVRSDLRSGKYTARELVDDLFRRIEALQPVLNCFLTLNEKCLDDASRIRREDTRPLAGIPVTIKDLILTHDMPTTGGSRVPSPCDVQSRDALSVNRLRKAGALMVGKTSLHEFAFGITNENEHFGAVRNPWATERMSGGSSGGSASALAARLGLGSVGTDTRGSIRIPSACCGICGLKPTRGLIPINGVIPLSRTLDHVGPMATSVTDLQALFSVLCQKSSRHPRRSRKRASRWPVLGFISDYFTRVEPEVTNAVRRALRLFEEAGFPILEVNLPELNETLAASDVISRAEAVTFHDRFLTEHPEGYGPQVRERLRSGYQLTAVDLVRAEQQRRRAIEAFRRIFRQVDCLLGPTLPVTAPQIGTHTVEIGGEREPIVPCFVRLTAAQNMAGVPSLSIPCGFSDQGLPVGLQLIAGQRRESILFELGELYQERTDWHLRLPKIIAKETPGSPMNE